MTSYLCKESKIDLEGDKYYWKNFFSWKLLGSKNEMSLFRKII